VLSRHSVEAFGPGLALGCAWSTGAESFAVVCEVCGSGTAARVVGVLGEILHQRWEDIDLNRKLLSVTHSKTPDGEGREIPLAKAQLGYHGYPRQIEDMPPGNVKYVYEQASRTGPYARQAGEYTRYGDVLPLLTASDDKLAVFGSGEEVQLDFDPSRLSELPKGWRRDYFFMANGYEKDMDFYAADGSTVEPLPFRGMGRYPYSEKSFPSDREHLDYMLKYNTRFVSGNEPSGYAYEYGK